jgi:hypothetical protein
MRRTQSILSTCVRQLAHPSLCHHGSGKGARQWERLGAAFGAEVAEAYRDGMKRIWRVTPPEPPVIKSDGQRTVKYVIILSVAGLLLEAEEDGWAERLPAEEADIAARHATIDDQGTPDWLGPLLIAHETIVVPHVATAMAKEWKGGPDYHPLLEKAAHGLPIPAALRTSLLDQVQSEHDAAPALISVTGRILARLDLQPLDREALFAFFETRLAQRRSKDAWKAILNIFAILFLLDQERAAAHLFELIAAERRRRHKSRAYDLMASLFGRHHGSVHSLDGLSSPTLARIIAEAYRLRSAMPTQGDDIDEDERPMRDLFDEAGGVALTALINRDGRNAYDQMMALSRNPVVGDGAHRLRELAYEMAERQSERPAWITGAVRQFEADALAPIASGADLLDLTCALIDEVAASFATADMSSRKVVRSAEDEGAIQDWLGETLLQRGRGRFHGQKESEIVNEDRPDIILSSATSNDQVAIEVKHGEKGWSFADLSHALADQLATRYLAPANRRHGVLVISNHRGSRFWRDPAKKRRMGFAEVILRLQRQADAITHNHTGPIIVRVRGIDAGQERAPGTLSGAAALARRSRQTT